MAVTGLRDLLSRVKLPSDEETANLLAEELRLALAALNQPGINEDFRNDILKIFTAGLDLMKTVGKPIYQVDEILFNLSAISTRISFLLNHVATSRPRTPGYGLVHEQTGKVLPNIWLNKPEADQYFTSMKDMGGLPSGVSVIPVEISSRYVVRPYQQALPAPQPQPESQTPLPRILQPTAEQPKPEPQPPIPAQPPFEPMNLTPETEPPKFKPPSFGPLHAAKPPTGDQT